MVWNILSSLATILLALVVYGRVKKTSGIKPLKVVLGLVIFLSLFHNAMLVWIQAQAPMKFGIETYVYATNPTPAKLVWPWTKFSEGTTNDYKEFFGNPKIANLYRECGKEIIPFLEEPVAKHYADVLSCMHPIHEKILQEEAQEKRHKENNTMQEIKDTYRQDN